MSNPKCQITTSLIISTYNWCEALQLCLNSVLQQSWQPDEILIADDGSKEETSFVISKFSKQSSVPVIHVWHEDIGFRKTIILNKAIAQCTKDYIIQIDGDLILHKHFIKDHIRFANLDMFVCGSRVKIRANPTKEIIQTKNIKISIWKKGIKSPFNGIRSTILSPLFQYWHRNDFLYARGCNMAFWKKDCIRINGYNEEMLGWGREDSEFACRLVNAGVTKRFLKFAAIAYHLDHKKCSNANFVANDEITKNTIDNKQSWCNKGISQYL